MNSTQFSQALSKYQSEVKYLSAQEIAAANEQQYEVCRQRIFEAIKTGQNSVHLPIRISYEFEKEMEQHQIWLFFQDDYWSSYDDCCGMGVKPSYGATLTRATYSLTQQRPRSLFGY